MGRAQEIEASTSTVGGINLEEAKKAMQEEDKFDKELFRQRIKAKHREKRLKANAEKRAARGIQEVDRDEGAEEEGSASEEDSMDDTTAAIIDALPDPDKVYGNQSDESDDSPRY